MTRTGQEIRVRRYPAGYFEAFPLGQAMDGILAVGEVVASRVAGFSPGDTVSHALGWREYAVVDPAVTLLGGIGTLTRLDVSDAEPQWHLGPLGGMGLTAYAGLHVVDGLRGGETIWVSAAAGAVGSLAVQIARLSGNRVIASAGSEDKVAWLRDTLGVEAFNHRDGDLAAHLRTLAPEGIDVYFDSVGGGHLEAALDHLARGGRAQPVPRSVQGPDPARLPGEQQPPSAARDAGPGRRLAARPHHREDAGQPRLTCEKGTT